MGPVSIFGRPLVTKKPLPQRNSLTEKCVRVQSCETVEVVRQALTVSRRLSSRLPATWLNDSDFASACSTKLFQAASFLFLTASSRACSAEMDQPEVLAPFSLWEPLFLA